MTMEWLRRGANEAAQRQAERDAEALRRDVERLEREENERIQLKRLDEMRASLEKSNRAIAAARGGPVFNVPYGNYNIPNGQLNIPGIQHHTVPAKPKTNYPQGPNVPPRVRQAPVPAKATQAGTGRKPVCPTHAETMEFRADVAHWVCPNPDCPIISYHGQDDANNGPTRYEGPLSILFDERTGVVWLRLNSRHESGPATLVKIADRGGNVAGISDASLTAKPNGHQEVTVTFEPAVRIDMGGARRP